jgi:hypothetical protein
MLLGAKYGLQDLELLVGELHYPHMQCPFR